MVVMKKMNFMVFCLTLFYISCNLNQGKSRNTQIDYTGNELAVLKAELWEF